MRETRQVEISFDELETWVLSQRAELKGWQIWDVELVVENNTIRAMFEKAGEGDVADVEETEGESLPSTKDAELARILASIKEEVEE